MVDAVLHFLGGVMALGFIFLIVFLFARPFGFLFAWVPYLVAFIQISQGSNMGWWILAFAVICHFDIWFMICMIPFGGVSEKPKHPYKPTEPPPPAPSAYEYQHTDVTEAGYAAKLKIPADKIPHPDVTINEVFDKLKWKDKVLSRSLRHIESSILTRSNMWEGETVRIEWQPVGDDFIEVAVHSRSNTGVADDYNKRNVSLAIDKVRQLTSDPHLC